MTLLPLYVAVTVAVLALGWRRDPSGPVAAAVVCSLAATAAYRLWGLFPLTSWSIAEIGVFAVLAGLVVHRAPVRAAAVLAGLLTLAAGAAGCAPTSRSRRSSSSAGSSCGGCRASRPRSPPVTRATNAGCGQEPS